MTTKTMTVPNAVIVCAMRESSSFMGQKADGWVYLPSKEALEQFKKHIEQHKRVEEYSYIVSIDLKVINEAGMLQLADCINDEDDRPWLWSNDDFSVKLW